jgi:hypothetical protein
MTPTIKAISNKQTNTLPTMMPISVGVSSWPPLSASTVCGTAAIVVVALLTTSLLCWVLVVDVTACVVIGNVVVDTDVVVVGGKVVVVGGGEQSLAHSQSLLVLVEHFWSETINDSRNVACYK